MFHHLLVTWFQFVQNWGYLGVFFLMALESSIVPVPSEIVMPPAAFWASQGKMDFWGVVLAGTLGSYLGSILSYGVCRIVGVPFLEKYGKYVFIKPKQIKMAEDWVNRYGVMGIFLARLLPVVRHLISMPAGALRMPILPFSFATLLGAFIWCTVLSYFGQQVIGSNPELLQSPEALVAVCRQKLGWFVAAIFIFGATYAIMLAFKKRAKGAKKRA